MSRRSSAQDYWDAYAANLEPPPGSSARNLKRIRRRIAAGQTVDDEVVPAEAPSRRAAAAGVVVLGKSAAATVGIAGAVLLSIKLVASGWAGLREPPSPPVASAVESSPSGEVSARGAVEPPISEVEPEPEPPVVQAPEPSAAPVASRAPARPRAPSAAADDRLRAEVALMDRARAALERGDAEALWRMMDEHARRFPEGALREERLAWRAVAACGLRHADAGARAARFLGAHPRSAQAAKVRRACDGLLVDRVTEPPPSPG